MRLKKKKTAIFLLLLVPAIIYFRYIHDNQLFPTTVVRYGRKLGQMQLLRQMLVQDDKEMECPIPELHVENKRGERHLHNASINGITCQRVKPVSGTCTLTAKLFGAVNLPGCRQQKKTTFCTIKGDSGRYRASCDTEECPNAVFLGAINVNTGLMHLKNQTDKQMLESSINKLMSQPNAGFCVIRCGEEISFPIDADFEYLPDDYSDPVNPTAQILTIPPIHMLTSEGSVQNRPNITNLININVLFIDSVSRHHFYRSLPKTVKYLQQLSGSHDNRTVILDFRLMQAIRSRTYESLQALFSGFVNPFEKPFSTLSMPPSPMNLESLLLPLKRLGYHTMWLEDMCYLWEWGISKDLLVHDKKLSPKQTWRKLQAALTRAGIDSLGNTYANCRILKENGVNDHFHGPTEVCYNGRQQHEYFLEYLRYYQEVMRKLHTPYFSFYQTNIGHDDTGYRIQYLDTDLKHYLQTVQSDENTVTILFSDHGNAYGQFIDHSQEGRIEMYQPFLFMIIPNRVQQLLGQSVMSSLIGNQHKLISLLDLHYMLKSLPRVAGVSKSDDKDKEEVSKFNRQFNVSELGLLSEISPQRTCDVMPRIMPNLCICEGYENLVSNDSYHYIVALFAVGQLNNEIQAQYQRGRGDDRNQGKGGFGKCWRLKLSKVLNVRESFSSSGIRSVKMDVVVNSPSSGQPQVFFVAVEIPMHQGRPLKLIRFERITPYSPFQTCADTGVDLPLCVCSTEGEAWKKHNGKIRLKSLLYSSLTKGQTDVGEKEGKVCVIVLSQSNKKGLIVELINVCSVTIQFTFIWKTEHLIGSRLPGAVEMTLLPGDVTFLAAGVEEQKNLDWKWDFKI